MNFKKILCISAITVIAGCESMADLVGYNSAALNLKASESYYTLLSEARSENALDTRSKTARRVHQVFNRMVPVANADNRTGIPFDWQMNVLRSDELNAWAMPGGKMAVYSGLVEKLHLTDDELAAVIGHEMTHALREHTKAQVGQQLLTGIGMQIGGAVLASQGQY